jgi:cytosine/adenosine deaminase-related metal-dependent hydrolase
MGGTRHGRFPELVAAGVPVALGSDSGNYADFFDIGRQLYLAATIHREARGVMPTITAEQAVEMATVHGARALRADDRIGSIEAGKFADIVIHSRNRPEWFPGVDPVNSLVYSGQSNGVDTVLVGGEVIVAGGRPVRIDIEAALAEIDASARSLFARMGYEVEQRWPIIR